MKPPTTKEILEKLLTQMASDPRFKGPEGKPGPPGPPGSDGAQGPPGPPGGVDTAEVERLEAMIQSLREELQELRDGTFKVEVTSPSGEILSGDVKAHGGVLRLNFQN